MATADTPQGQVTDARLPIYRLTVRQFEEMIDAGIFRESDHVELLGGLLVKNLDKMTKNDPHDFAIDMLGASLGHLLPPDWIARQEKSAKLGVLWRPEPDIAVVCGPRTRYRTRAPEVPDIALVFEVSDASYPNDRGKKWCRYAAAEIPIYWIVNIEYRRIEVYSDPDGQGKAARYRKEEVYRQDQDVPVVIEGRECGRISVEELLG